MDTEHKYKYYAFISYKREDEEWAKWLQHKLEHYKLPSNLNGRTDLPKEIRPIFRDQSDLAGGVLADEINKALESSKYLIVICSPRAVQSEWVCKEVQSFIDMGRTDMIIPFIVNGIANAHDPKDECFPKALRELPAEQELLGVNINEMGRDAAAVKVVAQMFRLRFDELWQRYEREQHKKRRWIIAVSIIGFLIMAGVAGWMYVQRQETLKANWKMMENQARFVAEKAKSIAKEDSYLARLLTIEVLPKDLSHPEKPYTIEAEAALRESTCHNSAIFKGHTDAVNSAVFSPDGKQIVSASYDKTIRIWDAETGKELNRLEGHTSSVNFAAFSPDGEHIASASDDNIIIWDVDSGYLMNMINTDCVNSVSYSPDGTHIASASNDSTVHIWDSKTGEELKTLKGHTASVNSVRYSLDGMRIVSASDDNTIRVWDAKTGATLFVIKGHTSRIVSASFSPNGKRIVSASSDKTIRIWNVDTGMEILSMDGNAIVSSAEFSPDGNIILTAIDGGILCVWSAETGNKLMNYVEGSLSGFSHIDFSPDGKRIVASSYDNTIRLLDIENRAGQMSMRGHRNWVLSASFSPNGKQVVSSANDSTIRIWDVETGVELRSIKGHKSCVNNASFSPDGKRIVSSSSDSTVRIWDVETGIELMSFKGHNGRVSSASFSSDGKHLVSSSSDSTVRIWDVKTGKELYSLIGHTDIVKSASFSLDGKCVVSGTAWEGTILVWDTETGQKKMSLNGHTFGISSVSFSHDGKHIVSTSLDGTIRMWDAETGMELMVFEDPTNGWVHSAAFSPDGKRIVSAHDNGVIRIWDVETGVELSVIKGHSNQVSSIAFSPDGKRIVSASADGTIRIWPFPPLQELIDETRERFKDNPLTPEERRMYYLE